METADVRSCNPWPDTDANECSSRRWLIVRRNTTVSAVPAD
jgi:hypothetical protein